MMVSRCKGVSNLFICEKKHSCCNYKYWDRPEDVEQEAKECGHLTEVAPVVHAKWEYDEDGMDWGIGAWGCSKCGAINHNIPSNTHLSPYMFAGAKFCPNCGAKMDLKE